MNYVLARSNMIEQQIRPWSVLDDTILQIMNQVPRECFVPPSFRNIAYSDTDIPLLEGQTMLSPKVVGRALQALNLEPEDKVLEIGTGTGYATACLSLLSKKVTSIEIKSALLQQAEKNLKPTYLQNIELIEGDGVFGWTKIAPFDAIFVTGSYPAGVPEKILKQLNPNNGRLFAFQGLAPAMQAVLITRLSETDFTTQILFETVVPALIGAPELTKFHF
jgi:protein-L-isoaspartate(D-aspartate) O-methyltransferase